MTKPGTGSSTGDCIESAVEDTNTNSDATTDASGGTPRILAASSANDQFMATFEFGIGWKTFES